MLTLLETAFIGVKVEWGRKSLGPQDLVPRLRARGSRRPWRDEAGRLRLRRAIRFVDRWFSSGGNCYRRVLIEIAMDAGAATEPLHLGLQTDGGPNSGHAWLGSVRDGEERYDAEFVV
jgi:hypothetical protein